MHPHDALERWIAGGGLSIDEAQAVMAQMLEGAVPEPQLGGMLIAHRIKGPSVDELVGFAQALRARAIAVDLPYGAIVDNCGTGGGPSTWNLSTGAAIVAAAAGARVGKHGNRAVTSTCGSADVLESLGVRLADTPETARDQMRRIGISFLFAPNFHPGLKVVGPVRRALKVRTVFNLLGPLLNPARARLQLVGIYDSTLLATVAETLGQLGAERAWVVAAEDGLDEVSPGTPTRVAAWEGGGVREFTITPADFGITTQVHLSPGATVADNAELLRRGLSTGELSLSEALIPNAAVTLMLAGEAENLTEAARLARETIASGAATEKLLQWQGVSRR